MYKSYKLVTFMVNVKGGESETVEHLYKEVDGNLVPCTKEESLLKVFDKMSNTGGNPSVQGIKVMLFNAEGDMIKVEELIKSVEVSAE